MYKERCQNKRHQFQQFCAICASLQKSLNNSLFADSAPCTKSNIIIKLNGIYFVNVPGTVYL